PGDPERLAFEAGLPAGGAVPRVELAGTWPGAGGAVEAVASALRGAGFELAAGGGGLRVIVTDDLLAPAWVELARDALEAGRAAFLVRPLGLRPAFGPCFTGAPGRPCPSCLHHALQESRPVERLVQRADPGRGWPGVPAAAIPASVAAAAGLAAIELRRLTGERESPARLWTLDLPRFELAEHRVRRRPQCPACGDPGLQAAIGERPVRPARVKIGFSSDGGWRREAPAESLARLGHLVSPVLGPVTHLAPMPGHLGDAPVFSSGYLVVPRRAAAGNAFDRNCAGKGCTADQARMSALAEAVERTSGVYRGDEALREATFEELGPDAIHPDLLHLFSEAQRARGEAPPRLEAGTRIAWTPAWSLTRDRRRWVPLAYCYSEVPDSRGAGYCRPSSNGSAAGGCLEEAILQGLFEAAERDAVAIWWYGRARRPEAQVPPSALGYLEGRRTWYAAWGWRMWPLDLTHDLGVPAVVAVAVHEPSDRLAMGFGAHPDPALAVRRAVSELDQVFDPEGARKSPWDGMAASRLVQLWPDRDARAVPPAAAVAGDDLREHVTAWVRRLEERGLETIVVDKTRPDLGLCVAQAIVPGLRHPWPRLGPGRLYTVPVALGWRSRPLTEAELQPEPLLV
ncbi:MAG TPA: TOMM precursor leader peptide-binding protein, partial [Myxococcales bacterium]|nr:TOMM precursor leader peptide-binding protein [Myxococcales bacterium]